MRLKPTYANVMATIAVFIALGGVSYAAIKLPKNSVGSKQLKKNAVTGAKVRDGSLAARDFKAGQLPAGEKGDPGPPGPPGHDATSLFAYIRDEAAIPAEILYGRGVTAVSDSGGTEGEYTLTFTRSLLNCVVQAVPGYGNPAGTADVAEEAIPVVSMETGGPDEVDVLFHEASGTGTDTSFLVTAFC